MKRTITVISIISIAVLIWGCARGPDPLVQRNKELEVKLSKVQADLAELNARFTDMDQRLAKEQAKSRAIESDRDSFVKQLKIRTEERDYAHTQLDVLVKNLETMLTQAKAARSNAVPSESNPNGGATSIKIVTPTGKSGF